MTDKPKSTKNYELARIRLWAFDSVKVFQMQIKTSDGSLIVRPMTISEAQTQADEFLKWVLKP